MMNTLDEGIAAIVGLEDLDFDWFWLKTSIHHVNVYDIVAHYAAKSPFVLANEKKRFVP